MTHGMVRRRTGFTLTGLVVGVVIMCIVASLAGSYYMGILEQDRSSRATAGLGRLARAWSLWQSSHGGADPPTMDALAATVDPGWMVDPWDRPFVVDMSARLLVCLGKDGVRDGADTEELDDLWIELPRVVTVERTPPPVTGPFARDAGPPFVTKIEPERTSTRRPQIEVWYADDYAGVDPRSIRLRFGTRDVTGEATVTPTHLYWLPRKDLPLGTFTMELDVADIIGRSATHPWRIEVVGTDPAPPSEPTTGF